MKISVSNEVHAWEKAGDIRSRFIAVFAIALAIVARFPASGDESAASGKTLILVKNGRPDATIVIASKPTAAAKLAAEEFQNYIFKISGGRLPIAGDDRDIGGVKVIIGRSALLEKTGLDLDDLSPNGYFLKVGTNHLILAGSDDNGDPRRLDTSAGTLFAVYAFLRDYLGVRWLWPGELGEVVPAQKTITAGELDIKHNPRLIYCYYGQEFGGHSAVTLWQRRNGIGMGKKGISFQHAFNWLMKKEIYDECPELFAMVKGKRVFGNHPCYNSPEFLKRVIPWARENVTKPGVIAWTLMPNDGHGYCDETCPYCRPYIIPNEENPDKPFRTDMMVAAFNKICEGVGDIPEGRSFAFRTYGACSGFPRKVKPHKRLMAIIFQGTDSYSSEITPPDAEKIRAWTDNGKAGFVMDTHWFGSALPAVFTDRMAARITMWNKYNISAFRCEAHMQSSSFGLMYYLGANMLRDPRLGKDEILADWYKAFGKAEPVIRDLYGKLENDMSGGGKRLLETNNLEESEALLEKAYDLVEDETARKRIEYIGCSFKYAKFMKERREILVPLLMEAGWLFHHRLIYGGKPPGASSRMPEIDEFKAMIRKASEISEVYLAFLKQNGADRTGVGPLAPYRVDDDYHVTMPDPGVYRFPDLQLRHLKAVLDRREVLSAPSQWYIKQDAARAGLKEKWFEEGYNALDWRKVSVCLPVQYQGLPAKNQWYWYKQSVNLPKDKKDRKISVLFGGLVMSAKVYVNGALVLDRVCQNLPYVNNPMRLAWRVPFEVEITPWVRWAGENVITVLTTNGPDENLVGFWRPAFVCAGTDPIPAPE